MCATDAEIQAARLALRRAEFAHYADPLDGVREACSALDDAFGLYAAGPMLELLSGPEPDEYSDPDEIAIWQARREMVKRLTLAIERVRLASERAFSPEEIGARQDAESAAIEAARNQGERIGRVAGGAQERADRIDVEPDECELRRAVKAARGRGVTPEPWELAIW